MKRLLSEARRISSLLCLMAVFGLSAFGVASAADITISADARARGMKEAPAAITAIGLSCELTDARYIGTGEVKIDNKTVKGDGYEVACKSGHGYFLSKYADGSGGSAFDCLQAAAGNAKDPKSTPLCLLPGNIPAYSWLSPFAQKTFADCTVTKARWIGSLKDGAFSRYEFACATPHGGFLDIPDYKNKTGDVSFHDCLQTDNNKALACTYLTHAQVLSDFNPAVEKAQASCQIKDGRYLGSNEREKIDYYEIGCDKTTGFILGVSGLKFATVIGCDQAAQLGAKCEWTDAAQVAAQHKTDFQTALKAANIQCTVQDFDITLTESKTNRDVIEFKCPEKPLGLVTLFPQPGSTAKILDYDCYGMKALFQQDCKFFTSATLMTHITDLAKADKRVTADCVIAEVRYSIITIKGELLAEIACVNKRGFLIDVSQDRTKLTDVLGCRAARELKDDVQCKIPGNGTHVRGT